MPADEHSINGFDAYTIRSADGGSFVTCVPERGGILTSIVMPGGEAPRELLYHHDFLWNETIDDLPGAWPFCFPVCARLERDGQVGVYNYDGQQYHLSIHGFAWQLPWDIELDADDMFTLVLRDNEQTRQQYPFEFEIRLQYKIEDGRLLCRQTYTNRGNKAMPYNAGFHPYFLTPIPQMGKANVSLNYNPQRRFVYNDRLTDIVGETDCFATPVSIATAEINEQLTQVGADKTAFLTFPDGDKIEMTAEGVEDEDLFPFIQLYTMAEKPFFCIEPWMGQPNAMNSVLGMRWLEPGQSEQGLLHLKLHPNKTS